MPVILKRDKSIINYKYKITRNTPLCTTRQAIDNLVREKINENIDYLIKHNAEHNEFLIEYGIDLKNIFRTTF